MRFRPARDIRQSTLELNQLAEDVRLKAESAHTHAGQYEPAGAIASHASSATHIHLTPAEYEELTMGATFAIRYDQDAEPPTIAYLGQAVPGASESAAVWRIQKLTFSAGGDVTSTWADGDAGFNNIWDDRASLTYS